MDMAEFITIVFFVAIIFLAARGSKKRVPSGTTIIIDRNSHYYKTLSSGQKYTLKSGDLITTQISKSPTVVNYTNIFKDHLDNYFRITFISRYKCNDVGQVLDSLQSSRRSIYDVLNCAVESEIESFDINRSGTNNPEITRLIKERAYSTLEPFYIDLDVLQIVSCQQVSREFGEQNVFQKHICQGDNPIMYC